MIGLSKRLGESCDDLFLCLHGLVSERREQAACFLTNHAGAILNPALPCFEDQTKQVFLYVQQKTQVSWMNIVGGTISLVGNKRITAHKIIYFLQNFIEAGIVGRVETKDGAGFTARDALCNNGINSLNIPSLFLNGEGLRTSSTLVHAPGW
jgi:hypothetical protein